MSNPIPHTDLIRAVLDGKTVQLSTDREVGWVDMPPQVAVAFLAQWTPGKGRVRLKPDAIVRYCPLLQMPARSLVVGSGKITKEAASNPRYFSRNEWGNADKLAGVLRVEFDPDTFALIKAEKEKAS